MSVDEMHWTLRREKKENKISRKKQALNLFEGIWFVGIIRIDQWFSCQSEKNRKKKTIEVHGIFSNRFEMFSIERQNHFSWFLIFISEQMTLIN